MSLTVAKDCADVKSCACKVARGQETENHVNGSRQIAGYARKMRSEPERGELRGW